MAFLPGSIVCFYKYNRKFGKKNQNDSVFTPKSLVKVLWYRVTGFFFNVVCCQVSTNNVHSYQLSCGLHYIALSRDCVCLFLYLFIFIYLIICSSIYLIMFSLLIFIYNLCMYIFIFVYFYHVFCLFI